MFDNLEAYSTTTSSNTPRLLQASSFRWELEKPYYHCPLQVEQFTMI